MEKEDGRKLAAEAQFERRKQAVRLHKQGKTPEQIAEMLGMGHVTVRSAIKTAAAGGIKALAPQKRGRPSGSCRQLSEEQETHIQRLICEKRPEQRVGCNKCNALRRMRSIQHRAILNTCGAMHLRFIAPYLCITSPDSNRLYLRAPRPFHHRSNPAQSWIRVRSDPNR